MYYLVSSLLHFALHMKPISVNFESCNAFVNDERFGHNQTVLHIGHKVSLSHEQVEQEDENDQLICHLEPESVLRLV